MTPLERSRFASEQASEQPSAMASAGEAIDSTRARVLSHHGWTTGVCDCLSDFKSCFATMVCEATVTAQLAERIWKRKYTCAVVATILWCGALGNLVANYYDPGCDSYLDTDSSGIVSEAEFKNVLDLNKDGAISGDELLDGTAPLMNCQQAYQSSARYIMASMLGSIFVSGVCVLTMLVRSHIRKRDAIPATACEPLDDCCCSICCLMCVQCQIMRHEGLSGDRYKLVSPDGTTEFSGYSEVSGSSRTGSMV